MTNRSERLPWKMVVATGFTFALGAACSAPAAKSPTTDEGADSYAPSSDDGDELVSTPEELGPEPKMSERSLPECKLDGPLPEFAKDSEGAAFRGLVRLSIAEDGRPIDLCFARAEGPLDLERKALAKKSEWKYDPKYAGQKRERLVTYRFRPPR